MNRKPRVSAAELRRRAEVSLKENLKCAPTRIEADAQRLVHELQVHQIELEMQNAELMESRDAMEVQMEKYSDLYDFAPVAYYSMDEDSVVLETNLSGASMFRIERSRLIGRRLLSLMPSESQSAFRSFLKAIYGSRSMQVCELEVFRESPDGIWATLQGIRSHSMKDVRPWCRISMVDITISRQVIKTQHRMEILAASNNKLEVEIIRRQALERALMNSQHHLSESLERSNHMQGQLRQLSHQVLGAQEEERLRISRELHDVIAQTLLGINFHLGTLTQDAVVSINKELTGKIDLTQRLVGQAVDVVHRFASDLRPSVLDDLGLIPALESYLETFMEQTGLRVSFTAFAAVEKLPIVARTALYRVAQEALTNVVRHANASEVSVTIYQKDDAACMDVHDNGKGFHADGAASVKARKRLGLLGIRERIEMIGGTFNIESAPGKETTIHVAISFKKF